AARSRVQLPLTCDTEQFVIVDGVRYSHVVDPHTGVGLTSRRQAAVVAGDGLTADGLSTALTVLDDSGQAALLRSYPGVVAEVWRARQGRGGGGGRRGPGRPRASAFPQAPPRCAG